MNESCHIRALATVCAVLCQNCTCEGVFIVVKTLWSRRTWLSYVISIWSGRRTNPMASTALPVCSFYSSTSIPSFVRWPPSLIPHRTHTHVHVCMSVYVYTYMHIYIITAPSPLFPLPPPPPICICNRLYIYLSLRCWTCVVSPSLSDSSSSDSIFSFPPPRVYMYI